MSKYTVDESIGGYEESAAVTHEPTYTTEADIQAMAKALDAALKEHGFMALNTQRWEVLVKAALAASPVHAELARLRTRLEMDVIYNHRGEPEPWEDGMPDGIDCRNQTIEILERNNENLREKLERVKALLDWYETLQPIEDWHEDDGCVLWWKLPVCEPPYCGTPLDSKWPDYHTHFTPIVRNSVISEWNRQALQQKGGGDE